GVAEVREAVGERAAYGFGADVQAGRGGEATRGGCELLEDVEDLERGDAAGSAGREREVEIAIAAAQWRQDAHLIRREIVLRDQPAVRGHVVVDRLRDGPAVERIRSVAADQLHARGQVGILDVIPGLHR